MTAATGNLDKPMATADICIVGGGVVGLSLAYQLAKRSARVLVVDRGQVRQSASWAGAGILPPAGQQAQTPIDRLTFRANQLHAAWAEELRTATGIDTGYRRCGGLYVARSATAAVELAAKVTHEQAQGVRFESLDAASLAVCLGGSQRPDIAAAYFAPDECQLRNPRHLQALRQACLQLEVRFASDGDVVGWELQAGRVVAASTGTQRYAAERYCLCSGAWTGQLTRQLGLELRVRPLRGQMVLYRLPQPPLKCVVNEGLRYLVPRDDGHVLAGSTMEEAGFDLATTSDAINELRQFATSLLPSLAQAEVEATWSGLRPASHDAKPYLGQVPGYSNLFVAAGHTRGGLQLSTVTAELVGGLILGEPFDFDLSPFAVTRD